MSSTTLLQTIGGCAHDITMGSGLYASLFIAGLVGGATHCIAMCGPFTLSQAGRVERLRDAALLPYHLGRITTYVAMAVLLSSLLNLAFLFMPVRSLVIAPLLMLAGVFFLVSAFPGTAKLAPWASRFPGFVPYRFIAGKVTRLSQKNTSYARFLLGMILGLMPCGLIIAALMAAASAPSPLQAGFAMASFGAGTSLCLIALGYAGSGLSRFFPTLMQRARRGLMIWSGLWLFAIAGFTLITLEG